MSFSKRNKWALIILGTTVWSITMVKSGLMYDFGLGFWGPNGHDGVWHLSLVKSLSQGSMEMPIFAGEIIKNYHLGFDVFLALIHRLTNLPVSWLYFQIIPPLMAFLVGYLSYHFIHNWTKSSQSAWWSVFFVYFGGSLAWIFGKGESAFWAHQSLSTLLNPPYALSLVILLLALINLQKNRFFPSTLLFVLLPQVKIYAGALALLGLLVASLRFRWLFKIFLFSTLISGFIFLIMARESASLLIFQPGWFLENLFNPDRLSWPKFSSALNTYRVGGIWWKAAPAYVTAFVIFWVGNMGTRLVKLLLFKWWRQKADHTWVEYFSVSVIIAGGIIPMLFVQSGTPWNTIQFFYYSLFFSSLLAGVSVSLMLKSLKSKFQAALLALLVIFLTAPTTLDSLRHYLPNRPPAFISPAELEALNFLSTLPSGVVLTYPAQPDAYAPAPRPLYLYESTAYVSAYSGQKVFMEDEVNLNITLYPWKERKREIIDFFASPSHSFLKKNNIRYLYLVNAQVQLDDLGLKRLFANTAATIYAVP